MNLAFGGGSDQTPAGITGVPTLSQLRRQTVPTRSEPPFDSLEPGTREGEYAGRVRSIRIRDVSIRVVVKQGGEGINEPAEQFLKPIERPAVNNRKDKQGRGRRAGFKNDAQKPSARLTSEKKTPEKIHTKMERTGYKVNVNHLRSRDRL
jgi:hypothetical protein